MRKTGLLAVGLAATTLLVPQNVWANAIVIPEVLASGNESKPGFPVLELLSDIPFDPSSGGWTIGAVFAPEVGLDTNYGPWVKNLQPHEPNGFTSNVIEWTLVETLRVKPGTAAWTDFHEEIVTPGYVFSGFSSELSSDAYSVTGVGTSALDIFFEPTLPPETQVVFAKTITPAHDCSVEKDCANSPYPTEVIRVKQYPTPIPAAAVDLPPEKWTRVYAA